jgi:two-component system cell cycle response regulator
MAKRILIVDDMGSVRQLLKSFLVGKDYLVEEACDGLEALMMIGDNPPDVVVLDVLMPKMDGLECCRRIKANASTQHIPVIIITSIGNYDQEREASSAGANSFLTKPVRKEQLLGKIWLMLKLSR